MTNSMNDQKPKFTHDELVAEVIDVLAWNITHVAKPKTTKLDETRKDLAQKRDTPIGEFFPSEDAITDMETSLQDALAIPMHSNVIDMVQESHDLESASAVTINQIISATESLLAEDGRFKGQPTTSANIESSRPAAAATIVRE